MASNVPKFASFRPKPKAEPEASIKPQPNEILSRTSKKKAPQQKVVASTLEEPKPDRDTSASKLYFSDRRGDSDFFRYGRLHRYDIPVYRRFGNGSVLGLPPDQKIDRELSSDSKIYITPVKRRREERLLTSKHAAKEESRTLRVIQQSNELLNEDQNFIAVSNSHLRQTADSDDEPVAPDYRGIKDPCNSDQPADPELQYDLGTKSVHAGSEVIKINSRLVRRTRECPGELQAWMDFIDHQKAMVSLDHYSDELSDSEKRQLADVRIPIYEEALKKIGNDAKSHIQLYLGMFREARSSWNELKLTSKWKEVLQRYPKSTELWFLYLDYVQSNFTQLKYEACRASFLHCLQTIQNDTSTEIILHVFIRMTSAIHDAGYQELALAIWQAVLEYHLLPPQDEPNHFSFEGFWESEAPRIGEVGAKGWRESNLGDVIPGSLESLPPSDPSNRPLDDFQKREINFIKALRYPGRTSDDIGEDDAFHTVFYADIEVYLKLVPIHTPSVVLVEAFLCFCGLPPLPRSADYQQRWWKDPFLFRVCPPSKISENTLNQSNHFAQVLHDYAACTPKGIQMTSDLLFEQDFLLDSVRLGADFVGRLLRLLVSDPSSEEILGEYLLALELQHSPKDVYKTAKQLLKARPSSQHLYHAYGLVESRRGNSEKAAQVFSMALSMPKGHAAICNISSLKLISTWVWEALRVEEPVEALWRLVSVSGHEPMKAREKIQPNQDTLLRAQTTLSETCENALIRHDHLSGIISTSLLALLAYLAEGCKAEVALDAHKHLSDWFSSHKLSDSPHAELHAQSVAQFLTYHATHAAIVKPALVRTALEPLIASFPNNTILLSLYAANEARFSIDDRVRGIMYQTAMKSSDATNIVGWSFAIHYETMRGNIAGSTSHSIRALYKRATEAEASGAHCPALWGSYLRFELAQLDLERVKAAGKRPRKDGKTRTWQGRLEEAESRVKDIFYQGLRSLPWCKDFMMLAFAETSSVLVEEELWKVYRVMQEKELRVYVELE
ncbi:NRDE-2, necessary for RNA interference-domain-containing protein [Phaeosphaeriaceae sp. PMI808]|nr:NRDE-2, necessary for RNA interference-domain-containing protein [Phaeosphaeriaceae sp. PMI808]